MTHLLIIRFFPLAFPSGLSNPAKVFGITLLALISG